MRVSRIWRDISARIQAGYGHIPEESVTPGGLAVFCPTCPQPGVNLPDDWREDDQKYGEPPKLIKSLKSMLGGYTQGALSLMATSKQII
jgi:hypothetical protein